MQRLDFDHPSVTATETFDATSLRALIKRQQQFSPSPLLAVAAATVIDVEMSDTVSACQRLVRAGHCRVAALNFASARNPGGGFRNGSRGSQEESLCRSSGLYPCLKDLSVYSLAGGKGGTCLYSDFVVYSPAVPVFKDWEGRDVAPFAVDFLTCPAPNAGVGRTRGASEGEIFATLPPIRGSRCFLAYLKYSRAGSLTSG